MQVRDPLVNGYCDSFLVFLERDVYRTEGNAFTSNLQQWWRIAPWQLQDRQ